MRIIIEVPEGADPSWLMAQLAILTRLNMDGRESRRGCRQAVSWEPWEMFSENTPDDVVAGASCCLSEESGAAIATFEEVIFCRDGTAYVNPHKNRGIIRDDVAFHPRDQEKTDLFRKEWTKTTWAEGIKAVAASVFADVSGLPDDDAIAISHKLSEIAEIAGKPTTAASVMVQQ